MSKIIMNRYGKPSHLDTAPYASQCFVRYHDKESYDLYIQTSKDQENPKWELIGCFNPTTSDYYINELISMRLGL